MNMDRREKLLGKLKTLYLHFRNCMVSNIAASELFDQGVDGCPFNLVEEATWGSPYFQPMSQECVNTLDKRPDFEEIPFGEDDSWPSEGDAHWVRVAITDQLDRQKDEPEDVEDLWRAIEFTSWEEVGNCCALEEQLRERQLPSLVGTNAPTKQTTWALLDMFATKNGLPHRSCIAHGEVKDVTGPTRHELMIVTGLMGVRMVQKAYLKHEVFPILMLSIYGSRARIVQAHMSPEQQRLQVRYSDFFDFRNLTKEWLDIFVRWFLSEPLAEPPLVEVNAPEPAENSDDETEILVPASLSGRTRTSNPPRSPEQGVTLLQPLSLTMWSNRCNAGDANLEQATARLPTLLDVQ